MGNTTTRVRTSQPELHAVDHGVGASELRAAMGHFATGVGVVTAFDGEGHAFGTTANALSSLSLDPPLILACLRRESETLAALRSTGRFAVNLLGADGQALADRFARRADGATWEGVGVREQDGVPLLDGALATLECRVHEQSDGGDHVIVIGRVVAVAHPDDHADPLLFFRGGYADLVRRDASAAPAAAPATAPGPEVELPSALGAFRMLPLPEAGTGAPSVAVLVGEPRGAAGALLYVHRGCLLGDALGSTACRGRERLHAALEWMERADRPGVVVYHRERTGGIGACCLPADSRSPLHHTGRARAEAAAVRDAIRLLDLHDPVVLDDDRLDLAA